MAKRPGKRQRHPLFDLPEARADFVRASQLERFTPEEAAAYIRGFNPDLVNVQTIAPYREASAAKDFEWTLKIIRRAIDAGTLQESIDPRHLIAWARSKGVELPAALVALEAPAPTVDSDPGLQQQIDLLRNENAELRRQLADPPWKAKRSFQIIMLAVANDGAGYRGKRSEAPAMIAGAAARLGLTITAPVVAKHLQEAIQDLDVDPAKLVQK